jgi:hypothetical protein
MKKWLYSFMTAMMILMMAAPTFAASHSSRGSFSGGSRAVSSFSTPKYSSYSSNKYSSGVRRPSSSVTSPTRSYNPSSSYSPYGTSSTKSGFGSFLGGMAVGGILGSMFHPFGYGHSLFGGYGGGYGYTGGFSLLGLIFDIIIAVIAFKILRRLFFGRRY